MVSLNYTDSKLVLATANNQIWDIEQSVLLQKFVLKDKNGVDKTFYPEKFKYVAITPQNKIIGHTDYDLHILQVCS